MGKILCATRGGEASIRTQKAAIQLAKERGDELIFFYVVDVEFMAHAEYAMRTDIITKEMDKMADFLLSMAVERAEKEGVKAHYKLGHGHFVDQLKRVVKEEGITLIILGQPSDDTSAFDLAALKKFAENLQREIGIQVMVPGQE